VLFCFRISAAPKPLLMNDSETAIIMVVMPINPNSEGESSRARMIPITKARTFCAKLTIKLPVRLEMVFCLRFFLSGYVQFSGQGGLGAGFAVH
jgi:hypothetical protein